MSGSFGQVFVGKVLLEFSRFELESPFPLCNSNVRSILDQRRMST